MNDRRQMIQAGTGRAVRLAKGDLVTIVNLYGNQVVDSWALVAGDSGEYLSVEHTVAELMRLRLWVGDHLYSNRRHALLSLVVDTSPGRHDMLMPACDVDRYRVLGVEGYHTNCSDNFAAALRGLGLPPTPTPNPLNLFQNVSWSPEGELSMAAPQSRAGDAVTLRAEKDLIFVMSACPQDLLPVNGEDQRPSDVEFEVKQAATAARRYG